MNMEVSYMNNLVRIEQIEINGIKNILHGEVAFQEYSEILKGDLMILDPHFTLYLAYMDKMVLEKVPF